ncbi:MAG TPA: hypothetical protein DDX04_02040, partial [Massilia sp.]|nr:hypothetical protein [Massilia sp.]
MDCTAPPTPKYPRRSSRLCAMWRILCKNCEMTISPDFSALFQASPYPYLLIDTDFILIGANPAYLQATGRTAQELVGMHIFDAFPANPADPDSTNLGEVRTSIELAIATRKPHTTALLRYAVPKETLDGTVFDERYWSAVHSPVCDAAGNVMFVAQNAIDVTGLFQADASAKRYHLKQDAHALIDVPQMSRPQLHEAMTRILNAERLQLQILFDQAPGFMAVMSGRENVFEMVNDAFYELVGRRALVGRPAREALPELVGQGFKELLEGAYESGQRVVLREQKVALRRGGGEKLEDRYVDLLFQPILGQDLRVTGIFVQGSDVTGAHQVGQELSEKVQQLEAIRSSQAFQLELADRIRQLGSSDEVTAAACALLGRRLAVSRVLYAEVDDARGTIFIRRDWTAPGFASLAGQTKTMDDFGPDMIADLRAGRAVVNSDVMLDPRTARHTAAYERIGIRSDLLLPVLKAGRLHVVLTIQDGAPRNWLAQELELARDVAERTWAAIDATQAQAALRTERDQSQTIFDSMGEGFAVVDRDWTILRMNAEGLRLNGRSAAEIVGRNHWEVFPELKDTETEAVYQRVMETGKSEIIELAHTLPDQTQAWSEIRVHRSPDGGIAFFFRDITERRAVQEQLRLADRRKDEFLAMLA